MKLQNAHVNLNVVVYVDANAHVHVMVDACSHTIYIIMTTIIIVK
jgi:hypothetical protein